MTGHVHLHAPDAHSVSVLQFSNPGKLNALTVQMWRDLRTLMEAVNHSDPCAGPHVIVVQGDGGSFVAGADIEEFPDFRFDAQTLGHYHEEVVAPALNALLDCERPLVAQIEGACVGGGLEIAACCDIRICGESSRFGVPIAKLGFPMAPLEIEIVARVIGETTLRELLLEARVLGAEEARQRGLVTRIVADAQVGPEARRSAEHMARLSPQALRLNKRALRQFGRAHGSSRDEREPHYAYAPSPEHREGLAAFNEKRPARFGHALTPPTDEPSR
ncbi:enoyl-CoA hydratase-related protein [Ideonella sp. DXS29W]|uniref:Enoyl-CoA hydratase-related protein n=1 Tax=Ideonella lacteola TaxID=2984193 RepID=A0ABU9BU64_9BURK